MMLESSGFSVKTWEPFVFRQLLIARMPSMRSAVVAMVTASVAGREFRSTAILIRAPFEFLSKFVGASSPFFFQNLKH
jgi:hypothetical protein